MQISTDVGERRERPLASDELGHELEPFVKATKNVEHQGMNVDGLTKIGKGISHTLHLRQ
jgi:hypothetical protein